MDQRKIWVFFYGSYINIKVLKDIGLQVTEYDVARIDGYDIEINPIVNLVKSDKECVYGIATTATHDELKHLYDHAQKVLGGNYLPEAVLLQTRDGKWRASLCYIANSIPPKPPTNDYIDTITESAKEYAFPLWYIDKLGSFRPN